ncbi:hypothetical protein EUAN_12630 [Andreesenia angusta]|uniref:Uncharacterized protein n=1 Tax=Andreesenia angusta TaxID=39480 RepID=A0A1S1V6Q9_9FIRM|nr:hypothetical protein [Andreesenia angusta]OHW62194.1 hypothetical protein EUAN_12630 [Andreesenia angusta]
MLSNNQIHAIQNELLNRLTDLKHKAKEMELEVYSYKYKKKKAIENGNVDEAEYFETLEKSCGDMAKSYEARAAENIELLGVLANCLERG